MSRLLMYGIKQQRRKVDLGFEPYVAPVGFDRTAQPVDIYDVFNKYYKTNSDARWICYVLSTETSFALAGGTSYRWAQTIGGVETITDVSSSTGTISWTAGSTKRWVICNKTGGISSPFSFNYNTKCEWIYLGPLVNAVATSPSGNNCTCKYIHINRLDDITTFYCGGAHAHYYSSLTGVLYLSRNLVDGEFQSNTFTGNTTITGTLTIPNTWTKIKGSGLNTTRITSVVFESESQLTSIEANVFSNLAYVTGALVIPDSVISIGASAFKSSRWTSITLSNTLQTIGANAFESTYYGGTLALPDSITTIGNYAFNTCVFTGTLTIPTNLTSLGYAAFRLCNFSDIDVSKNASYEKSDYVLYDVITAGQVKANYGCKSRAGSLTLRSDTTQILEACFDTNTLRTGILTIPDTVTVINANSFAYCSGLTGLILETSTSSLTSILSSAFISATALTGSLVIPSSLVTLPIGWASPFYNTYFTSITGGSTTCPVSDNVLYFLTGSSIIATSNAGGYTGTLTLRADTTDIAEGCFHSARRTGTLTLPATLVRCYTRAFWNATSFSGDLVIPSALVNFPNGGVGYFNRAFEGMSGIWGSIVIQNTAFNIGSNTFDNCINVGRTSGGIQLPSNYSGNFLNWSTSKNLGGATTDASIINITNGTKTVALNALAGIDGFTCKQRLLAYNPNAITDAAARGITVNG